jgi:hypothetical protein
LEDEGVLRQGFKCREEYLLVKEFGEKETVGQGSGVSNVLDQW